MHEIRCMSTPASERFKKLQEWMLWQMLGEIPCNLTKLALFWYRLSKKYAISWIFEQNLGCNLSYFYMPPIWFSWKFRTICSKFSTGYSCNILIGWYPYKFKDWHDRYTKDRSDKEAQAALESWKLSRSQDPLNGHWEWWLENET